MTNKVAFVGTMSQPRNQGILDTLAKAWGTSNIVFCDPDHNPVEIGQDLAHQKGALLILERGSVSDQHYRMFGRLTKVGIEVRTEYEPIDIISLSDEQLYTWAQGGTVPSEQEEPGQDIHQVVVGGDAPATSSEARLESSSRNNLRLIKDGEESQEDLDTRYRLLLEDSQEAEDLIHSRSSSDENEDEDLEGQSVESSNEETEESISPSQYPQDARRSDEPPLPSMMSNEHNVPSPDSGYRASFDSATSTAYSSSSNFVDTTHDSNINSGPDDEEVLETSDSQDSVTKIMQGTNQEENSEPRILKNTENVTPASSQEIPASTQVPANQSTGKNPDREETRPTFEPPSFAPPDSNTSSGTTSSYNPQYAQRIERPSTPENPPNGGGSRYWNQNPVHYSGSPPSSGGQGNSYQNPQQNLPNNPQYPYYPGGNQGTQQPQSGYAYPQNHPGVEYQQPAPAGISYQEAPLQDAPSPSGQQGQVPPYMQGFSSYQQAQQSAVSQRIQEYGVTGRTPVSDTTSKVTYWSGSDGGVGKTTAAWIAANITSLIYQKRGIAQSNPVWLVEADYQNPKLEERLGLQGQNLGSIAAHLRHLRNTNNKISNSEILGILNQVKYTHPETGLNILVAPYKLSGEIESQWIKYTIQKMVQVISNSMPGNVFIDAGTLTDTKHDNLGEVLAGRLAHDVIVVSDPGHINDCKRTTSLLTNNPHFKRSIETIHVFMNRATAPELREASNHMAPWRVEGGFPRIPEIDTEWVGRAPSDAMNAMTVRMGQFMVRMGYVELAPYFSNQEVGEKGQSIIGKLLRVFGSR